MESVAQESNTEPVNENGKDREPDFSIGPNAEYYVTRPDDVYQQLREFLGSSRGGVFGITGVRGAGKSVLLKRIEAEFEDKHHILQIPAPVSSSEETAFFTMLFRQLCRSVVTYINRKVLKKKEELALISRREYRKWIYAILFLLPILAVVAYGLWFYGSYYYTYKKQFKEINNVFKKQFDFLNDSHTKNVESIVLAVKEGLLSGTEARTDAIKEQMKQIEKNEEIKSETENKIAQVNQKLQFLLSLLQWEEIFVSELGAFQKAFGDIPHPLRVLYDSVGRSPKGAFSLERFYENQKQPFWETIKKSGLSIIRAESLIDDFTEEISVSISDHLNAEKPFDDKWINEIINTGDNSFNRNSLRLANFIEDAQKALNDVRSELSEAQAGLKESRRELIVKERKAATKAGSEVEKMSELADKKAKAEAFAIRQQSDAVANAFKAFETYPETLAFDFFHSKSWRPPLLPSERHALQKQKDQTFHLQWHGINAAGESFVVNLEERVLVKEFAEAPIAEYSKELNLAQGFLRDAMDMFKASGTHFSRLRDRGTGPLVVVASVIGAMLVLILLLFLGVKARNALKYRDMLGLLKRSEEAIRNLEYVVTRSQGGRLTLPFFRRLGASFSFSEQQRGRALTLPGLTALYVEYIRDVQRVLGTRYGSNKLIICIDELDKITDPKQVGNVLREIKGALYEKDCFYLLSISEDAVRTFEGRLVEQRDIFESTFDEIMYLDRLDLKTCIDISRKRCNSAVYGSDAPLIPTVLEAMEIAAVLSTGVPRELLRNLRAVENAAGGVLKFEPEIAWQTLFRRKLKEIFQNVRAANGKELIRADLITELLCFLESPEDSYDEAVVQVSLRKIRKRTEALMIERDAIQTAFTTTDQEIHATALKSDMELVRTWIKYWIELELHLMVRYCSLLYDTKAAEGRSVSYAVLLSIYGGLPYSTEATARRLSQMKISRTV